MFFRTKSSPSGHCLQLLESYRNAQGDPRHRVVVSLGQAPIPENDRPLIASVVESRLYNRTQPDLLAPKLSASTACWIDNILKRIELDGRWQPTGKGVPLPAEEEDQEEVVDGVLLSKVDHTHDAPLGPSLVGLTVWRNLKMEALLEELGFNPAQSQAAAVSVIHRLVSPGSERSLLAWLPDSSLPELLGLRITEVGKDRFYRISDRLLEKKEDLERHLRQRQGEIFQTDRTFLLYDLTNSYFEGEALQNPKAKRGQSKEKRHDRPLIVVGMVFDRQGCELMHKVFEGNQSDGQSLVKMVEELKSLLPKDTLPQQGRPLVIVDAGVATKANLSLLREKGFDYLVNESRRGRVKYREEFLAEDQFRVIEGRQNKSPVKVRLMADSEAGPQESELKSTTPGPGPTEATAKEDGTKGPAAQKAEMEKRKPDSLILCQSQGRREKEEAIRSQAEGRYETALKKLAQRIKDKKLQAEDKIQRSLGRLQERHPRVQRFYTVTVQTEGGLALSWVRKEAESKADQELLGCYVLRTNKVWEGKNEAESAETFWKLYLTLTQAEEGFRMLKSSLGLRPNHHQKEDRVEGHVFITVLAYHLLWSINTTLSRAGDHRSWETIKEILRTHCYATILLPTKGGKVYRIRKAGIPEESQVAIYRSLKVEWKHLPCTKIVVEPQAAEITGAKSATKM